MVAGGAVGVERFDFHGEASRQDVSWSKSGRGAGAGPPRTYARGAGAAGWAARCGDGPAPRPRDVGCSAGLSVIHRRCVGGRWNRGCRVTQGSSRSRLQQQGTPSPCRPHPPPRPGMSNDYPVPMAASSWSPAATPASGTSSRSSCRPPEPPSYSAAGIPPRPKLPRPRSLRASTAHGCGPYGWTSLTSRRSKQRWNHWRWNASTR